MNNFIITFAGAIGCGTTPIANYLSYNLNLAVFNNDAIRVEVMEDLLEFNQEEFIKRRDSRANELLSFNKPVIYDAALDRTWIDFKPKLDKFNYKCFVISLDLSKEFLVNLYKAKNYTEFNALDRTFNEHQLFLEKHSNIVNLSITDNQFKDRLSLSLNAAKEFIKAQSID